MRRPDGAGRHATAFRDPAQAVGTHTLPPPAPGLLRSREKGAFWETLAAAGVTLLVTREYEHLLLALGCGPGGPETTALTLPHPSGIAADLPRGRVHVASTRNPNQLYELRPATGLLPRDELRAPDRPVPPILVPVRTRLHPGCLYLHDLAMVGGRLHGNAVGMNAVVRLDDGAGAATPVWWPRSIETPGGPLFSRNVLQLNSIAAGDRLSSSFFTASGDRPSARRPGQRHYPVDRRGVVFSGRTRDVIARGLTRPHSARLHEGRLYVDDSGYGRLVVVDGERCTPVVSLPGWTRGLALAGDLAFVGTSRILPRFEQYAPGLVPARCVSGIHAVDLRTGGVRGSLLWPEGDQIFAVEAVPRSFAVGLPFRSGSPRRTRELFYAFRTEES
ncbi:MAG: DUF4915 domain-containing protein [Holophagales bacterium]|nr:DUF4915 domain-containing protein [Holophagales bacterium]MBK9963951.1 DUF4915 domain-containing protein [Holophagales bacterium]